MKTKDLLQWGINQLKVANKEENIAFFTLHYIDKKANMYLSNLDVDEAMVKQYKKAIKEYICNDLPISIFFGYTFFYNKKIFVEKNVYLPRFETEQLVDELFNYLKNNYIIPKNAIDICTGVGPIAICLKDEFKNCKVTAIDSNKKAIELCKKSAKNLNLDIDFLHADFLLFTPKERFDLITMNPPYISKRDYVEKSVLKNDPLDALFAENDGYFFYDLLSNRLKDIAQKNFVVCLEIGNQQATKVKEIFFKNNKISDFKIIKDYQKHQRIIIFRGVNS